MSIELESHARRKCALIKDVSISSHITINTIDFESIMNAANDVQFNNDIDILPSKHSSEERNSDVGENAGKIRKLEL